MGVAILFARDFEAAVTDPQTVIRDPAGRYLAVRCNIHGRDTMFRGAHAANKTDARQGAYYLQLCAVLLTPYNPSTDYRLLSTQIMPWTGPSTAAVTLPLNKTTPVDLPRSGAY